MTTLFGGRVIVTSMTMRPYDPTNDEYKIRKERRRRHYEEYVKGWKLKTCHSCSGLGHYDNTGGPLCSSCEGTGRVRYKS